MRAARKDAVYDDELSGVTSRTGGGRSWKVSGGVGGCAGGDTWFVGWGWRRGAGEAEMGDGREERVWRGVGSEEAGRRIHAFDLRVETRVVHSSSNGTRAVDAFRMYLTGRNRSKPHLSHTNVVAEV